MISRMSEKRSCVINYFDNVNESSSLRVFRNEDDAVKYVLKDFNTDRTKEWFIETSKTLNTSLYWLEEFEGKLYYHWMTYDENHRFTNIKFMEGVFTSEDAVCDVDENNFPTTLNEFKNYIKNDCFFTFNSDDRSSVDTRIIYGSYMTCNLDSTGTEIQISDGGIFKDERDERDECN